VQACNAVIEIGWLFALILTPLFFNVFSARSFEPDKTVLLRSIAIVMSVVWLIRWFEEYPANRSAHNNAVTGERTRFLRLVIDTPCVLPVLLFLSSYILSTIISIFPRISFFGSYSRLQGLYTVISYAVIFFILLDTVKTREQIERFFRIIIFASIPISLYGILQHYQLDTLTWSMTIDERITGANMGNPIFVAAYLIMVVPVTIAMLINSLTLNNGHKRSGMVQWVTASTYSLIIILQVLCILFTQSRGPWLGFFAAFFVFFLGTLIYLAQKDTISLSINYTDVLHALLFSCIGIVTGFLPAYLYVFIKKKGFRWLWLGFIFQALIITCFIVVLNLPHSPLKGMQKIPYVSRLSELSYKAESGTTKVRILIWEGTTELIRSNPIRMIVGYGPESMKHVWDPYSPAELAQHESKSAAPDRAHNEALDRVVTTGLIGFFLYMSLVGSIFYFCLTWLGLITSKQQKTFFFLAAIGGGLLGAILPRIVQGTFSFSGIGLSFGFFIAVSLYMMAAPFFVRSPHRANVQSWKYFLILGLMSSIVAHFIEIQFGIAIASTRLYFFAFSGILVALGIKSLSSVTPIHEEVPIPVHVDETKQKKTKANQPRKKQQQKQILKEHHKDSVSRYIPFRPVMVYSLITGLVMSTILFAFVIYQPSEKETFGILWVSLVGQKQTYGTFILLILTYLFGGLLVLDSLGRSSIKTHKKIDVLSSIGLYTVTNVLVFFIFSFFQTSYLKPDMDIGGVIVFFFVFLLILGLLAAYFLMPPINKMNSLEWKKKTLWAYALLLIISIWAIYASNITPVMADIYLKLGMAQERSYRWNEATRLVNRAIEIDPYEETYYLNLGRILFGKANSSNDLNEKNAIFEKIRVTMERAHTLNPMNTDHIANLGLLYLRWAEFDPSSENRQNKLRTANRYFQQALERSQYKTIILNNWARVFAAEGNFHESIKVLNRSLALDSTFAGTYIALGDVYSMYGKPTEAIQAYEKAVTYDQSNADAMSMLGLMYFKEGRLNESLELTRKAVELRPSLMKAQSLLGMIYFKLGRFQDAIDANLNVLSMRPSDIGAHRNLVILYEKVGRRDKAIRHLEAAIQYASPQEKPQLEQVLQYMRSGKSQLSGMAK
jgi:tetratricopeptide (TPR) repeat protein/O-antigen ligase